MDSYQPEHRLVHVRLLTQAGFVSGHLHLAKKLQLLEFLNHAGAFLTLSDVSLQGRIEPIRFFAVQRQAVLLAIPTGVEAPARDAGALHGTQPHAVSCLLDRAFIRGAVEILRGTRVSDFFHHNQGFVAFRQARLHATTPRSEGDENHPLVLVNTTRMIGVTELG